MDFYCLGTLDLWLVRKRNTNKELDGWMKENLGCLFHTFFPIALGVSRGFIPLPKAMAPIVTAFSRFL